MTHDPYIIPINEFLSDNRKFVLKQPVQCTIEFDDELWVFRVNEYQLHSFSEDIEQAWEQLHEEFAATYDDLIDEPDENLTADAIELKQLIRSNLEQIKTKK